MRQDRQVTLYENILLHFYETLRRKCEVRKDMRQWGVWSVS